MSSTIFSTFIRLDLLVHGIILVGVSQLITDTIWFDVYENAQYLVMAEFGLLIIYNFLLDKHASDLDHPMSKQLHKFFTSSSIINIFAIFLWVAMIDSIDLDSMHPAIFVFINLLFLLIMIVLSIFIGLQIRVETEEKLKVRRDIIAYAILFYIAGLLRIGTIIAVEGTLDQSGTLGSKIGVAIMSIVFIILWPATIDQLDKTLTRFDHERFLNSKPLYPSPSTSNE